MKFFRLVTLSLIMVIAFTSSCNRKPGYRSAPFNGRDVVISMKTLREKIPEFYTMVLDGKKINFFLVKINGDVQSYFDACPMCYQKRVGCRVEGEKIVCRACNLRYSIYDLKTGNGNS